MQPTRLGIAIAVASAGMALAATRARADGPGDGRYFGLRLTLGAGAFYYPQIVDGGYYINNRPYDLTWYGVQGQVSGEAYAFLPFAPRFTLGAGGSAFRGFFPNAMDPERGATTEADGSAPGGYGGVAAGWWLGSRGRFGLLVGYGGTGVQDKYGGWGVTVSACAAFVRPFGDLFGGLGVRFTYMHLSSPGDADTRSEKGGYMTILLEGSLDWAPRFGGAEPTVRPEPLRQPEDADRSASTGSEARRPGS